MRPAFFVFMNQGQMSRGSPFDTAELRRFITNEGVSLTLDELLVALRKAFPNQPLPSRAALGRYRVRLGLKGRFGLGLRNPYVRAFLDRADRRVTMGMWQEQLAARFPDEHIPTRKAISRYFRSKGQRKPKGRPFDQKIYDLIDRHMDEPSIDQICALLKREMPDCQLPTRSSVARYCRQRARLRVSNWWDRQPDVARFIVSERSSMTFDEICRALRRHFPRSRLPSRSAIARYAKSQANALAEDRY